MKEKRKTSLEKENQSKNIIKPVLNGDRKLRSERTCEQMFFSCAYSLLVTPNAKTTPKINQQLKTVTTNVKESKPTLRVGVSTPKPTTSNHAFGRNLKKEEPTARRPQTSISPTRTQAKRPISKHYFFAAF